MNLLITGAWQGAKEHIPAIEAMGHSVQFLQFEKDSLPCAYEWVEGVICNGLFLSHPIEKFSNLRYIQLTSAGFDRVPMAYVQSQGITVHNAAGVYSIPMAEFALCGVLQLYKQSRFFLENQKQHKWEKHRSLLELAGKTVCIIGCGSVGSECAKRFYAFGCRVIGVDVSAACRPHFESVVPISELHNVLPDADVIVLCLPLTAQTKGLFSNNRFSVVKSGAILVNISRGAIVDTDTLVEALRDHLGGAVLDVFEEEPIDENSPLWDMRNVIVTPHNSFVGDGNSARLNRVILDNLNTVSFIT